MVVGLINLEHVLSFQTISTNVVPSLDAALEQKESEGRALREAVKATEDNLEARVQENALLQVNFVRK